jgi:protein TonB
MLVSLKPVSDDRPREPQFAVAWEARRRNFASSLLAVLSGPKPPKGFQGEPYFRDCRVGAAATWFAEARKPKRALLASLLWHIVLFTFPFPIWKAAPPRAQLTLPQIEVTWYGPVQDLPQLNAPGPASKPSPPGEPRKPLPPRGANAFHPRQTIISAPRLPTHPRQTLIQPDAPPVPPKILPQLPNVVLWAESSQPARPRLQINRAALARLQPKKRAMRPLPEMAVPEVPNLERRPGELNIASSAVNMPKPQLPMAPTSVPRVGPRELGPEAGPAPDIRPDANASEADIQRLVAISAAPAPSGMNLPLPAGNITARVFISPEGTQPGVPGGSPNGTPGASGSAGGGPGSPGGMGTSGGTHPGNGAGPPGVSISGGNPNTTSVVSGAGARPSSANPAATKPAASKLGPGPAPADPGRTSPAPGFERIKPGAPPEEVFAPKRVYTLHVNMPNLASVTGSWVLSFVEMSGPAGAEGGRAPASGDLSGPVPLRKVDPKYPPALIHARVEGEVVLYAVIRKDGSVDSIQLVKGIEPELDGNAMEALARWKFRPAQRKGAAVELEAIVHIPFHAVAPLY